MKLLNVSSSPHMRNNISTQKIMMLVLISLLPSVISAGIIFGPRALLVILTSVISAVGFEYITRILMKKPQTISDLSSAVTGVILALNLPVTIPLWIVVIGNFVAITIVKQLFGGIGQNFANPAIVARIVLLVSFGSHMSNWVKPFYYIDKVDLQSYATPLVTKAASYKDLFFGTVGGCIGETSALALLIGGILLIAARAISPSTPLAFIGSVALFSAIAGTDPLYQILSGGLFLGAFFMATDYSTTPITIKGKIIFGIGCGFITFAIRYWGNMPEGVSYSILLMNILTPYIDKYTKQKPIGIKKITSDKGDA